jgi:hypothetical protein
MQHDAYAEKGSRGEDRDTDGRRAAEEGREGQDGAGSAGQEELVYGGLVGRLVVWLGRVRKWVGRGWDGGRC